MHSSYRRGTYQGTMGGCVHPTGGRVGVAGRGWCLLVMLVAAREVPTLPFLAGLGRGM
jgi:hypothetical protein